MNEKEKYQRGQSDKKGQQNNQGKHAQSQGGDENKKSPKAARAPSRSGRPANIPNGKTTAAAQKSSGRSTGGPTSRAGR